MPEFDEELKEQVKRLDGYRCQICGRGVPDGVTLDVHHWKENRGMGSKESVNKPENLITLCRQCHLKFSGPGMPWKIVEFDRDKGILEVIDSEGRRIPHSKLWFYRQALAEKLQPIEARLQALHQIDGKVAKDLYTLWEDDNYKVLDPDATTFKEYLASRGMDVGRAMRLIKLYQRAIELGIEWPAGMSLSDFRRQLQGAGEIKPQSYWYVIFKPGTMPASEVRIIRTDDPETLMDALKPTEVAARVGKWFKVSAKNEELVDYNNFTIPFTRLPEEAPDEE